MCDTLERQVVLKSLKKGQMSWAHTLEKLAWKWKHSVPEMLCRDAKFTAWFVDLEEPIA